MNRHGQKSVELIQERGRSCSEVKK